MKKTLFIAAALTALFTAKTYAQVSDVSVTVSPLAGYTWWDKDSAIENGMNYGARVGFGFGQNVELRAVYQKSADLKSTAKELTNDQNIIDKFESRDVTVTRWGGEFKGNIPTSGWFAPYLTLGTGVQTLETDNVKEEQIYADFGLGTKFNLSDRVVLTLEGKGSAFNLNPGSTLRSTNGSEPTVDQWVNDNVSKNAMLNWSAMAGVQFYLGGSNPDEMTALDYAYQKKMRGGLSDFKFIVEPVLSYVNFDDNTNFKDTYLMGANLGFDFTELVGVRGYYMQATKNEEISTKWDHMAMYGGDFIARLNMSTGVVPYLSVGGGYMNVYDDYKGENGLKGGNDSGYFAKGGVGLNIPLGTYIEVFGSANMLLTTASEVDKATQIEGPEELRKNVMYTAGLRLKLGAKEDFTADNRMSTHTHTEFDRMDELNRDARKAYCHGDLEDALMIMRERERLAQRYGRESIVRMSPQELESLVNEVLNGVDEDYKTSKGNSTEERIDRLERLLLEVNKEKSEVKVQQKESSTDELNKQILMELKKLNMQMQAQQPAQSQPTTVVVTDSQTQKVVETKNDNVAVVEVRDNKESALKYQGVSGFAGVNFGNATVGVLGVKSHYNFNNSDISFVPDVMIGFGNETAYALNANVHFPIKVNETIQPYVGTGLSLNNFAGDFKFGPNIIIGTGLNVMDGKLYVEYTSRNLFDNNQVAVGYKFGL